MKSNPIKDKKYLDGEKLFTVYWQDMGTARSTVRLQRWCLANSIVNPKTQNVPTRMGLWKAMWRWATNHPQEAFEIWKESLINDKNFTPEISYEDEWNKLIVNNAKTSFQNVGHTRKFYHAR